MSWWLLGGRGGTQLLCCLDLLNGVAFIGARKSNNQTRGHKIKSLMSCSKRAFKVQQLLWIIPSSSHGEILIYQFQFCISVTDNARVELTDIGMSI